jgi:DNA-binding FrmR family transcriptional regulator
MLETPKALDTIALNIISKNSKGCYNGQSAGNQQKQINKFKDYFKF